MNSQQTFYEYIMNWLDKFNISVEVTQSELKDTLANISSKAVKYEMITSIIWLILCTIAVIIAYRVLINITKTKGIKNVIKYMDRVDISKNEDKILFCIITIMAIVFAVIGIISQVVDITECILFPEKIVLEFIGRYL